ncbi:flagellar type III secretion system pore protein FliP [Dasania sp. GY-MA-18]|uniref:Flagellar biosynthetic protein FliP n=1 Tax=Dasania phycosphaerae TaxID=2950436 RepID=A0A9J6RIR6_9GAMM|nr:MULTISPECIES: flagellar type III secretion system pore protein FliP [Dasania]MCR8921667.1 flagellar type III secretion system pore protein FliP [Dasania sp. GY-MA-18]MCZ0864095.1 flagellar type III secretion system pore protein FliP [Dasania phycosphaerae]MCZ0867823.1 flagellar type III secretion system pore protein FliP [Dasania phycosphaerae]
MSRFYTIFSLLVLLCFTLSANAQSSSTSSINSAATALSQAASQSSAGIPAVKLTTNADGSQEYTVTLQILALMTVLTLLPSFLIMMTSFTRIIIVFAILRQALGLQSSPSSQILLGLTVFLTIFIMMPVFNEVNDTAVQPYLNEQMTSVQALEVGSKPFHYFMMSQTRESDLDLFMRISKTEPVNSPEEVPFFVLAPAFVTSELKTAFQIGFLLFIPFLIIDMVVASVLMAMGMMMLSPVIISLPFKIMLFVMVDGWAMIIGTLAASFGH